MQAAQVALSRSVLRRTLDARRAVLVPDTGSDRGLALAQSIVAGRIRSALCVPLMRGDDVTGFIYVDSRRNDRSYGIMGNFKKGLFLNIVHYLTGKYLA